LFNVFETPYLKVLSCEIRAEYASVTVVLRCASYHQPLRKREYSNPQQLNIYRYF